MTLLGGTTPGSAVAPPEHAEFFFDKLASQSVMLAAGIQRVMTDHHSLKIPKLVDDVTSAWTEEGSDIAADDPDLTTITATPQKLAALTFLSNEIVADSVPAVLDLVGTSMARSLGLKLDLGFLQGSGTAPEIRGLRNVSGIGAVSMGANGAALTDLDPFADALGLLDAANAGPRRAIVMHPRNWTELTKVKEATGSNKPVMTADTDPLGAIQRRIYGVPVYLTSQLSVTEAQGSASTANSVYLFDVTQVVAVIRNDVSIQTSTDYKFNSDSTAVRGTIRADLVVPNPAAVVRVAGIIPAA